MGKPPDHRSLIETIFDTDRKPRVAPAARASYVSSSRSAHEAQ
jgi:hypothetical protein